MIKFYLFIYLVLFCFVFLLQVLTRRHHNMCPTLSHRDISYLSPNNLFSSLKHNLLASVPNRHELKNLVKLTIRYSVPSLGEETRLNIYKLKHEYKLYL
jgi:hypothetical protein